MCIRDRLSNDGPEEAALAAAAGQAPPVETKEEVKEEPKEDDSSAEVTPTEASGHRVKVRPSSSLGAYART
eukprot:9571889-Alexandrium_andersonii.AAC.1